MLRLKYFIFFILLLLTFSNCQKSEDNTLSQKNTSLTHIANSAEEAVAVLRENPVKKLPDLKLKDKQGKEFNLNEQVKEKPVILIVYRGGWCPYCNRHFAELTKIEDELINLGYQIWALSPDRPEKLKESIQENNIQYTLLSDSEAQAIQALGLAFKVEESLVKKYKDKYSIDLEDASGKKHHVLPVPAAYVINTKGEIVYSYYNVDYKTRVPSQTLLEEAKKAVD